MRLQADGAVVSVNMQTFGGQLGQQSPVRTLFFAHKMLWLLSSDVRYRTRIMGPTKRRSTLLPMDYKMLLSEHLIRVGDCA